MLSYSSWLTSHQFKTKHYSSDRFKTTAKTTFKPKCLNTLPVYFILRVHLHELFTNLTNLSCRSLHFFPPFHRLLQPLFPHKVFPLFPHFLQCLWTLSRPFSSFFSSTLSVAFFPYLSFFICASVWSPVQASNEVPRITQEKKLAPLSACRGGSLAAGECANSTFLSVPFACFALTSGLQQPAENDQILVRSTPLQVSLGYPSWRTAMKSLIRHKDFKKYNNCWLRKLLIMLGFVFEDVGDIKDKFWNAYSWASFTG